MRLSPKPIILIWLIMLIIDTANAATIHGSIYDIMLERVDDARVEIDTEPGQFIVAKDGSYSLNAPEGVYTIRAEYYEGRALILDTEERITVKKEGDYVLDLILFPVIEEDEELMLNESDYDIELGDARKTDYTLAIVIISVILLAVLATVLLLILHRMRTIQKRQKEAVHEEKEIQKEIHDDSSKVISVIKNEGGRTTQKEIRKHIPLSEAKISLLIAELEHKGIIEKIRKGRGNIIILKAKK